MAAEPAWCAWCDDRHLENPRDGITADESRTTWLCHNHAKQLANKLADATADKNRLDRLERFILSGGVAAANNGAMRLLSMLGSTPGGTLRDAIDRLPLLEIL